MKSDLFEVIFRDDEGEILVGFASSLAEADRLICMREERLMIEDIRRGIAPALKNESDAADAFTLRLRKQICKYASRRAG